MERSSKTVRTVAVILLLVILGTAALTLSPIFTFRVTHELVGPEHPEVWGLLWQDGSLDEFKKAVLATGKHVDEFVGVGGSLLSNAVQEGRADYVPWLLEQGANPNGVTPGSIPLKNAIYTENIEMIKILLRYGASPDYSIDDDWTPRNTAEHWGNPDVIEALNWTPDFPEKAEPEAQ